MQKKYERPVFFCAVLLCKRKNICYNIAMKNEQNKGKLNSLLGEPTPQKAAGISFSLAPMVSAALLIVAVVILTAFGVIKDNTYTEQGWFRYVSFLLPQIAFFVVILFYFSYTKRKVADACKAQKCHPKYFVWAVIMQVGLFSFGELNGLFLEFLQSLGYTPSPVVLPPLEGGWLVLTFIVVALLPALFEEIFFRGILLKGMQSFGVWGAVLISGAYFSIYHQNPPQTVYQFICGAAFALVAIRSGSILPTVLSHFLNNAFILVLQALNVQAFTGVGYIVYLCVCIVCLLAAAIYFIFIDKSNALYTQAPLEKEQAKKDRKQFLLCSIVGVLYCLVNWISGLFMGA